MIATVLFLVLILTLFLSVPIGICLGLATMAVMILVDGTPPLVLLARSVVTGADSFPLIAVPLFILAGDLMQHGGMSRRLVGFANALIGHIRAGLSYVNVLACVFFAAISGSSPATVAAIGSQPGFVSQPSPLCSHVSPLSQPPRPLSALRAIYMYRSADVSRFGADRIPDRKGFRLPPLTYYVL